MMDWRPIIKRALANFRLRPLEEYIKPVDKWDAHKHASSAIVGSTTTSTTSITTVKPQTGLSVMGNLTTGISPLTTAQISSLQNSTYTYNTTMPSGQGGGVAQSITGAYTLPVGGYSYSNSYVRGSTPPNHIVSFHNNQNKEIVRLNTDGSVTWANGVKEDEAAEAFARVLSLGAEMCAGITYGVKQRIRDATFEELIDMAKTKGSLTVDDLTYMLQAAKIMDKLKGIK